VALAEIEALAAYHIVELDKDEDSNTEIFTRSFVAWHVFFAALGATAYLGGDWKPSEPVAIRYKSTRDSGLVQLTYRF
jgi:hypothetical protein